MYMYSLACVRVKGDESEWIMSLWFFNIYISAVMKEIKMGIRRRG